jgi:hypothetical protein
MDGNFVIICKSRHGKKQKHHYRDEKYVSEFFKHIIVSFLGFWKVTGFAPSFLFPRRKKPRFFTYL